MTEHVNLRAGDRPRPDPARTCPGCGHHMATEGRCWTCRQTPTEITTSKLRQVCATTGPKWVALDQGDATLGVKRVLLKKICARLTPRLAEDVRWTLDLDALELRVTYRGRGGSSRGRITLHLQYIPRDESRTWMVST